MARICILHEHARLRVVVAGAQVLQAGEVGQGCALEDTD